MAEAPSYAPLMPSSSMDWTMAHRKAGQYSLARFSATSPPHAPMGTKPMEWMISSGSVDGRAQDDLFALRQIAVHLRAGRGCRLMQFVEDLVHGLLSFRSSCWLP